MSLAFGIKFQVRILAPKPFGLNQYPTLEKGDNGEKKKEKEMKANAKVSEVKEIRFTPNTDEHDFNFKAKHAESFLKEGNKVKAYVQFKGRAIQFQDRGQLLLLKFAERLAEVGNLESMPKMEGRRMLAMFAPKGKKKGDKKESTEG